MERMRFRYTKYNDHNDWSITNSADGGFDFMGSTSFIGVAGAWHYGQVNGLRSWGRTVDDKNARLFDDYYGEFKNESVGVTALDVFGKGVSYFHGVPDDSVNGIAYYTGNGLAASLPFDISVIYIFYEKADPDNYRPYFDEDGDRKSVDPARVYADLKTGIPGLNMSDIKVLPAQILRRTLGYSLVYKYAEDFNGINYDSYR